MDDLVPTTSLSGPTATTRPVGYHSRTERRTTRREARRKQRASRLLLVAGPVVVAVIIIALLFAFLVSPAESDETGVTPDATITPGAWLEVPFAASAGTVSTSLGSVAHVGPVVIPL